MDLGLKELTDDQLLELVVETCNELAARDPYIRNMAQATITTAAEDLELRREAVSSAVKTAQAEYVSGVVAEALDAVRRGVRDGTMRLLTPAQEAKAVVDATLAAKIKLIDEMVGRIESGAISPMAPHELPQYWGTDPAEAISRTIGQCSCGSCEEARRQARASGWPLPPGLIPSQLAALQEWYLQQQNAAIRGFAPDPQIGTPGNSRKAPP